MRYKAWLMKRVSQGYCSSCGSRKPPVGRSTCEYCREKDRSMKVKRRKSRKDQVLELFADGRWRTLGEIRMHVPGSDEELRSLMQSVRRRGATWLHRERADDWFCNREYLLVT